jgi:hypothetical protein
MATRCLLNKLLKTLPLLMLSTKNEGKRLLYR